MINRILCRLGIHDFGDWQHQEAFYTPWSAEPTACKHCHALHKEK